MVGALARFRAEHHMNRQRTVDSILQIGIVPVIRVSSPEQAMLAVEAVGLGGIPAAEITMTVPGAIDLIRKLVDKLGSKVLVGAGTVLDVTTAQACIDAGAAFLVSPGLDIATIELAAANDTVMIAGALTPTEVITCAKAGADFVKIFPCGLVGGPRYIKALRGPLPNIRMIPTGGVNLDTAADFIVAGAAALGIGSELVSVGALGAGNPEAITEVARNYVEIVGNARARMHKPKTNVVAMLS